MKHLTKLFLICILLNLCVNAQNFETVEQQIDALFSKYNTQTPGVAVAIVKDGKIIFKKGLWNGKPRIRHSDYIKNGF